MQNKLFATMITALLVLLMAGTAMCAPYDSSVDLENKDSTTWLPIADNISAVIEYSSAGEEFAWDASGTAAPSTEYSLIYYADMPDRFNDWGGDNPGALIGTFTTDVNGAFDEHEYTELGMDLPCAPDANMNISENNYTESDGYTNPTGAKLWMVPSSMYDEATNTVTSWSPDDFLFETDLITYADCDEYFTPNAADAPDNATFSIGDVFGSDTVPIMILNATDAGSVDITLTYDPTVVSVTGVTGGEMDSEFWNLENNDIGEIRIGAYQASNPGLNGDFVLANVEFESVSDGECDFGIMVTTYKDATPCGRSMPNDVSTGGYCSYLNGDVNGDGAVDMFDAMYLAKYTIGISGFDEIAECASEVSGDGILDIHDASYLAKYIIGGFTGYETLN